MPLNRYQKEIETGAMQADPEQRAVINKLQLISDQLKSRKHPFIPPPRKRKYFPRWKRRNYYNVGAAKGLYLWGGVGRGKTHLCDLFFEAAPFEDKTRLHFHHFMKQIHDDLRQLGDIDDPLLHIADDWASRSRLLLLDEIHVNDITDAMLLGGLLTALFRRGVTLVTTSNVPPEGLYKDGLQRARFLPAIAQIRDHTEVIEMVGVTDYRMRLLRTEPVYRVSSFTQGKAEISAKRQMQKTYDRLRTLDEHNATSIEINARTLPVLGESADLVWMDFETLCVGARSTEDYIAIANRYQTVLISDIPIMGSESDDAARRFVNMIDEFYDRHVKLIVTAEATAKKLYTGTRLAFEFERAASRLFEMQTTDYLKAPRQGRS